MENAKCKMKNGHGRAKDQGATRQANATLLGMD